jgi:DNA-binding MarR family transcriptional regulator
MREPDRENPAKQIGALMRELMTLLGRSNAAQGLQVLHRVDLTLPQIVSLRIMRAHGPQTVSALAGRVRLTAGSVSRLVDQLVARRLVGRTESAADRRHKVLKLTAAGARLIDQFDSARDAGLEQFLAGLDRGLAGDLRNVLERVIESLTAKLGLEREV